MELVNEPRYTQPLTVESLINGNWNEEFFRRDDSGRYLNWKAWLDQGADVNAIGG
jgi:hypothetical protein